ncbi:MAG: YceD family protein [Chromatiales bacterium]|jgi:uncharacterized protein
MSQALKDCLDPWKAADRQLLLQPQVAIASLPRLAELLIETDGEVEAKLEFARGQERMAMLSGHVRATLVLRCQRCLKPMAFPVDHDFEIVFVHSPEQAASVPEQYDAYEVEQEQVCIEDIIEDELLLSLPQVAMHAEDECMIQTEFGEGPVVEEQPEKENPFAVLAALKSDKDD